LQQAAFHWYQKIAVDRDVVLPCIGSFSKQFQEQNDAQFTRYHREEQRALRDTPKQRVSNAAYLSVPCLSVDEDMGSAAV
jgi:hypothetical protein